MVNPGAFSPLRKAFLLEQKPLYATAATGNYTADCIVDIQRRYFKWFPIDLPHDQEPSAESLAQVDDNAADPEPVAPNADELGAEEYEKEMADFECTQALIVFRKAQIKRWMAYQYHKDRDISAKDSSVHDAYTALLHRLTGKGKKKPRLQPAMALWKASNLETWKDEVKHRVGPTTSSKKLAAIRIQAMSDLFKALPPDEKEDWNCLAVEDHLLRVAAWEAEISAPLATDPQSFQNCIEGLVQFVQPILDIISDATGWKATLLAGGPEPADGGRLNIISVHSGHTTGTVKMNFGRSEREGYKNSVLPLFGRFLRKCYTVEQCRARALATPLLSLEQLDLQGDDATFDRGDDLPPTPLPAPVLPPTPPLAPVLPPTPTSDASPPSLPPSSSSPSPPTSPSPSPSPTRNPVSRSGSPPILPPVSRAPSPSPTSPPTLAAAALLQPSSQVEGEQVVVSSSVDQDMDMDVGDSVGDKRMAEDAAGRANPKRSKSSLTSASAAGQRRRNYGGRRKRTAAVTATATSTTPASSAVSTNTDGASSRWFLRAMEMLELLSLGAGWSELIATWAKFEAEANYEGLRKLPANRRSAAIGDWIQHARSPTWRPVITAPEFKKAFYTWWTALQPAWRVDDAGTLCRGEGDLTCVRVAGVNGILSALAALFFWGAIVIEGSDSERLAWTQACDDVAWVVGRV
ncbi:hypothetical protein Hypma_006940 [Hypsizygus marmoreus]|uniref:Uncharacterized protein n=1 Tax=Hypsizygus marmoreus TaxID=39966 RepID=A0A369JYH8_HYPMA|nr:hypothetical protein Hypma_006940 [Hypsizygus marmoreus]